MCRKSLHGLRSIYLGLLLLSVPLVAHSQQYDGPALPPGWMPIRVTIYDALVNKVALLKDTLAEAKTQQEIAQQQASEAKKQADVAVTQSQEANNSLMSLTTYLNKLGKNVRTIQTQRNLAVAAATLLTILTVYLAIR